MYEGLPPPQLPPLAPPPLSLPSPIARDNNPPNAPFSHPGPFFRFR